MSQLPIYNFYGLSISIFNMDTLDVFLHESLSSKNGIICYGYSLGIIPWFIKHPKLYTISNKSDLLLTDGRWLYSLLKLDGCPITFNLSIPDFVYHVLKMAERERLNVFLFGATEENNVAACQRIKANYPEITIFGRSGFYSDSEETGIVNNIASLHIDILLVGLPSPQKEEVSFKYKKEFNVSIIVPCGGMIDVLSGKVIQSPRWVKRLGLASFYRVMQEPRRLFIKKMYEFVSIMFYILPVFLFLILFRCKRSSVISILKQSTSE